MIADVTIAKTKLAQAVQDTLDKGASSDFAWTNTYLSLLSEIQVCGIYSCSSSSWDIGCDNLQLPLFALDPTAKICGKNTTTDGNGDDSRQQYWLKNVVSVSSFSFISDKGYFGNSGTSYPKGVRPIFCIG